MRPRLGAMGAVSIGSGLLDVQDIPVTRKYEYRHEGTKVVVLPMSVRRASTATDSIN